ncbi:prefoldin subunit 3 [Drosophila takahashii]|uniref:prefoldin subunit 3 n=1 Tax=Drosophila takahashii TaxID=29030 RepID=UPI003898FA6B
MFQFMKNVEKPPLGDRKSYMPIPEAKLIGEVERYIAQPEFFSDVQVTIKLQRIFYLQYSELAAKLEVDLTAILTRLDAAKNNLELVKKFMDNPGEEFQSLVQVTRGVFRWVTVLPVKKVTLQVGTALQMDFDLLEAEEFIKKDITSLVKQRLQHEHDIDFLQDQVNTIEMNLAVLYKHGLDKEKRVMEGGFTDLSSGS